MSNLIPIIADILPMVNPGPVQVTKASDLHDGTSQTAGMQRKSAIQNQSSKLCASVMIAAPHTSSAVHHHAEQDTIIYAVKGHGAILSWPDAAKTGTQDTPPVRHELGPGDFALVPAYAEHQEVNDGDEEVVWVITRSGTEPVVVNLEGWGGKVTK